jgi:hypothetical protein
MIPVFERAKTVHASDRAATGIGLTTSYLIITVIMYYILKYNFLIEIFLLIHVFYRPNIKVNSEFPVLQELSASLLYVL